MPFQATAGRPPLEGIRVLEFAGLAPAPFAGLLLSDYGASVLRIDRPLTSSSKDNDLLTRHKSSLSLNLKSPPSTNLLYSLLLTHKIDILIDPYRPGVLESLNLGPEKCLSLHPGLIYARISGFPREGKYSKMAGHDINYLSLSGGLSALGRSNERPYAPGNVIADFAGGGGMLVTGILLALINRARTGKGQVVEANMVSGSRYLFTFPRLNGAGGGGWGTGKGKFGIWSGKRGENLLDGGAPFYDTYETKDGEFMAVGCLEPQFYDVFVKGLGLAEDGNLPNRLDNRNWPELRRRFDEVFKSKTRKEWEEVFDGTDACVTPVKSFGELEVEDRVGFMKPPVGLLDSPGRMAPPEAGRLRPGQGGEEILKNWCGWVKGRDYDIVNGTFQALEPKAKL